MKNNKSNAIGNGGMGIAEKQLVIRPSIRGSDKLKKCKDYRIEGEIYYDFE